MPEILDLTICLSAFLGLGRTLRALGITETSLDRRLIAPPDADSAFRSGGGSNAASRSRMAWRRPTSPDPLREGQCLGGPVPDGVVEGGEALELRAPHQLDAHVDHPLVRHQEVAADQRHSLRQLEDRGVELVGRRRRDHQPDFQGLQSPRSCRP